jgi:GNAT superfamily N-acetyltransferase
VGNEIAIGLRPASAADEQFLLEVYATTRSEEMALVPWSEDQKKSFVSAQFQAQQDHYQKTYPDARHDVILLDGHAVGRLYVARLETEIRIVDVTLMPNYRKRGIGSALLRDLKEQANELRLPLRIYVETFNPSFLFFTHRGFVSGEQQGIHVLMEWSSQRDSPPN